MTKIPFYVILCKNDGIRCRKIYNDFSNLFKWPVTQKNTLDARELAIETVKRAVGAQ